MINTTFHEIHQIARLSTKEVNELLKDYELYSSQWSILFTLNQNGSMTQSEISYYLNVEAPTVTRTLIRLEKNNWIIRKEGKDKRERIVHLSDHAKKKIPGILQRVQQLESQMLNKLSAEEQEKLMFLLLKIKNSK